MKTSYFSALFASCLIACALATPASAVIKIDFENIPAGNAASNFLAPYGISSVTTSGTVPIDDFTFVPEPTSIALLCLATCGVLGARRRKLPTPKP
jgi:hypothetical protein